MRHPQVATTRRRHHLRRRAGAGYPEPRAQPGYQKWTFSHHLRRFR